MNQIGVLLGQRKQTAKDKAQQINRELKIYGSFAEIGAGQEVGRWFFRVPGASSTVAKTISAYDMLVSDSIYGAEENKRYVCESRLQKMLGREYKLMIDRLEKARPETTFFAFADTVAAKSSKVSNNAHGWMGVRFQTKPGGPSNDVILHVKMHDNRNYLQQEALGLLGVNLIYGAFFLRDSPDEFLESLFDELDTKRIEIDFLRFSGPDLEEIDNRLIGLKLVEMGSTQAVLFLPNGEVAQPSELLYGKNLLLQRGSFRPVTNLSMDMQRLGVTKFKKELGSTGDGKTLFSICELTLSNLKSDGKLSIEDFLARVDLVSAVGLPVLVSNFPYYFQVRQFVAKCGVKKVAMIMGVGHLNQIFDPQSYKDVDGGVFEALGKLFAGDMKLFIYPALSLDLEKPDQKNGATDLHTAQNYVPPYPLGPMYVLFQSDKKITSLEEFDPDCLVINSRKVLELIRGKKTGWESQVPPKVLEIIKDRKLFRAN